jgi:ubiquitin carboxyl-terminal hydrolase 47
MQQHRFEIKGTIEEYIKNGPHVYELYAVMIHSGGALGGHYFTYIKSFENDYWYNFNDEIVRKIRLHEIEKVFGDPQARCNANCNYKAEKSEYYLLFEQMIAGHPPTC